MSKSILWKNRDGILVTITPAPHKIASIFYSKNADADTVCYYDNLAEQAKPSINYKNEDEIESELVEELLQKFEAIGIDTSEWEYKFGDGNSAAEFIQAGIQSHLEKLKEQEKIIEPATEQNSASVVSYPCTSGNSIRQCNICGSEKVLIRGRYPKEPQRIICPCCAVEKLESIEQQSNNQTAKNG